MDIVRIQGTVNCRQLHRRRVARKEDGGAASDQLANHAVARHVERRAVQERAVRHDARVATLQSVTPSARPFDVGTQRRPSTRPSFAPGRRGSQTPRPTAGSR